MKIPSFKDVRLPLGSIPSNWPLLLGAALSVVVLVGLLLTGEEVVEEADPLNPAPPELGEVEAVDPRLLVQTDIDQQAARRRAEQLEAERRRLQETERIRREATEEARARAAALARAEEQLAALRARQAEGQQAPEQETPMEMLARTADEADLLETLRLEDIARRAEAVRAPMVVSSARGIGERQHALRTVGAASAAPAAAGNLQPGLGTAAPIPPAVLGVLADPVLAGPQTVPPTPMGLPAAPGAGPAGGIYDDPVGGGLYGDASPVPGGAVPGGRVGVPGGNGRTGTFTSGPAADGGTGGPGPTGVVVTPHDGRDYRLYEGTMLPAVLREQLDGSFSGPLSAMVTRHVYSADRQRVLIPRGTVALGASEGVQDLWQGRLAIGFNRLIFPDGRWVRMDFAGMNGIGETSLRDQVNRHYLQMFAAAGGVGLLAGFAQGGGGAGQGQFRSAVSEQMASTSLQIVSQFLNRLPEVTIRAGHRVNIRLMQDLVVPAEAAWDVD